MRLLYAGYFTPTMAAVALQQQQQQLEQQQQHISQKTSSRQILGLPPAGASIMALPPQQAAPLRGSIVTGYPVRPPPAGSAMFQNMPGTSQVIALIEPPVTCILLFFIRLFID